MAKFQLVLRSDPAPGMTYPLEGDQITIGRDSTNGVAINHSEVSRRHSKLSFQGGKYVIEDMGSTNGTFVNGQRLGGQTVLKPGDVVSLGEQIVLMYDAISMDAGATVAASRKAVHPSPVVPAAPPSAPPAAPAYSPPVAPAGQRSNTMPMILGLGVLLFLCACGGFLWWVDSTFRWCTFFGWIIPGC